MQTHTYQNQKLKKVSLCSGQRQTDSFTVLTDNSSKSQKTSSKLGQTDSPSLPPDSPSDHLLYENRFIHTNHFGRLVIFHQRAGLRSLPRGHTPFTFSLPFATPLSLSPQFLLPLYLEHTSNLKSKEGKVSEDHKVAATSSIPPCCHDDLGEEGSLQG